MRLRVPHPKLAKLHPAQIADLVEAASRQEGEEIIQAVGDDDRELEADVFEELDDHHQREFLEDRPDEQVAADPRPHGRRRRGRRRSASSRRSAASAMLALLPVSQRVKVRALLGYDPAEAGGLMSPDFVLLPGSSTAEQALRAVRHSRVAPELLTSVFVERSRRRARGQRPGHRAAARRARPAAWTPSSSTTSRACRPTRRSRRSRG